MQADGKAGRKIGESVIDGQGRAKGAVDHDMGILGSHEANHAVEGNIRLVVLSKHAASICSLGLLSL